ncbi:MAG: tetratricopeptide repeat protein [Sphingobacteriales bacterium]|nr:MAG: tetratricopeptide repeat protein [Sphingobacteriales bacterium]
MRQLAYIFLLLLATANTALAEKYDATWWKTANGYYSSKQYDSALSYFSKIAALSPRDAVVYYNLGNTYYRLNQIGPAVLNYERALKIKPSYKEAEDNLTLAQSRISNRISSMEEIFFVRWWRGFTSGNTATFWAVFSLLLFVALIAILLAKRFGKAAKLPSQVTPTLSVIWLLVLFLSVVAAGRRQDSDAGVVMQNDAQMLSEPDKGKVQGLIPEGTTVNWEAEIGTWVEVKLPDGREGYIRKEDLSKI